MEQAVLADFMVEGHFERHIRRTRSLYAERQEALVESVERDLGGLMEVRPSSSGMDLIGRLARGVDDRLAQRLAAQHDVEATPLSIYYFEPPEQGGLLLGYTGVDEAQIATGTRRLAEAFSSLGSITAA